MTYKYIRSGMVGGLLLLGTLVAPRVEAQAPTDAYRNVQQERSGTAKAQAMGGAMGAVGADPTAVLINPAGTGLFNSTYLAFGFDFGRTHSQATGTGGTADRKDRFGSLNHASYYSGGSTFQLPNGDYLKFNGGVSYDRTYRNKRGYDLLSGAMPGGLPDLMVFRAQNAGVRAGDYFRSNSYDPFLNPVDPLVAMGMNGGMITMLYPEKDHSTNFASEFARWPSKELYPDADQIPPSELHYYRVSGSHLGVTETGYRSTTSFNFGLNYNDWLLAGIGLDFGSQSYTRHSMYTEQYEEGSHLEYGNALSVSGSSFGVNLGLLVAIGEWGRVGVAYRTPEYAQYKEQYQATSLVQNKEWTAGKQTAGFDSGEYRSAYGMTTPGQWTFSAMVFLFRYGMVSYDYQLRDLGHSKLLHPNSLNEIMESQFISEDYGREHTHRIGLELRPLRWLSLRGGYSYTGNPMRAEALRQPVSTELTYMVPSSGMITDFVLPRSYQSYSAGIGLKLGSRMTLDLAYVQSQRTELAYPLTPYSFYPEPGGELALLGVNGGTLTTSRQSGVATLTFRF